MTTNDDEAYEEWKKHYFRWWAERTREKDCSQPPPKGEIPIKRENTL